jgi:DNA polymerase I-like protein with 3'-5' exonuclease and polymerase domains
VEDQGYVIVTESGDIGIAPLPIDRSVMSMDFEATGFLIYAAGFESRLFQVSFDGRIAYIFNAQKDREIIKMLVRCAEKLIVHNSSYDLAVLDHCFGVTLEETWAKTDDTQEMGRILYPTFSEKLKDLARKDLDVEVDSDKALREEFKRLKLKPIAQGYALIPLDNEVFVRYAGLDAIYTFKLWKLWTPRMNSQLLAAEHSLQYRTAAITRRGQLIDVEEIERQIDILDRGIVAATERLEEIGLPANIRTDEGRTALETFLLDTGCKPNYTPKSKKLKVGADDLKRVTMESDDSVKDAIADLKFIAQAERFKTAYLFAFKAAAESDGRLHATIRTMAARTHRMSISSPPLQQIPSHEVEVQL